MTPTQLATKIQSTLNRATTALTLAQKIESALHALPSEQPWQSA